MANRTALFSRKQSGGVFTVSDIEAHPGNIWFVDSGTGTNGAGYGQNPDAPVATVDYAVGLCTASNGDVIYVMPGHNEALTAATSCVVDVAGVSIIGLGRGMNRPIFDFDNTAGTIEMDAANTRLSNVVLRASVASTVVGINVDADDVEIDNCYFTWETTGDEFVTCIDINAYDRTLVHDNVFETEAGAGAATEAIHLVDTNDVIIRNNIFRGTWTDSMIFGETTLSARLLIEGNVMYNSDTGSYGGIDPGSLNTTGIVRHNAITSLYSNTVAMIKRAAHLTWHDNTFANAVAEAATGQKHAVSIPATSSG